MERQDNTDAPRGKPLARSKSQAKSMNTSKATALTKEKAPAKAKSQVQSQARAKVKAAAQPKTKAAAQPKDVSKAASKAASKVASKAAGQAAVDSTAAASKVGRKVGASFKAKANGAGTVATSSSTQVAGWSDAPASAGIEPTFSKFTLLNAEERYQMMARLQAQNPNPKSELNYTNSFELICAVVLSAQATDTSVNKVTPALFKAAPNAQALAELGEAGIGPLIQTVGLWRNKAKHLAELGARLVSDHGGEVPSTYEELIKLPGVGSKTARVVLNVAFGQPFIAVDTHVYRVCQRTGLCLGTSPQQVEQRLPPLIAAPFLQEAHHYLLLHGRYNCTAKKYQEHCPHCVIAAYCKKRHQL